MQTTIIITITTNTNEPITIPAISPPDSPLLSSAVFLFSVGLSLFVEQLPENIIKHDLKRVFHGSAHV